MELFKGLIIGFLIAAPVGPIGVLCIKRSLVKGWLSGLLTGLGAATADAAYGAVAAFGLTLVSDFLIEQKLILQSIGIIFLVYLGVKTFLDKPSNETNHKLNKRGLISDYLSTVGLTITNPATIASFMAVFIGVGITADDYASASVLVFGVFLGSAAWWLILSGSVSLLRQKVGPQFTRGVNLASGTIILGFAVWLVVDLF